jgi:hypothetical protein
MEPDKPRSAAAVQPSRAAAAQPHPLPSRAAAVQSHVLATREVVVLMMAGKRRSGKDTTKDMIADILRQRTLQTRKNDSTPRKTASTRSASSPTTPSRSNTAWA